MAEILKVRITKYEVQSGTRIRTLYFVFSTYFLKHKKQVIV